MASNAKQNDTRVGAEFVLIGCLPFGWLALVLAVEPGSDFREEITQHVSLFPVTLLPKAFLLFLASLVSISCLISASTCFVISR